jgi:hypothetical protein
MLRRLVPFSYCVDAAGKPTAAAPVCSGELTL